MLPLVSKQSNALEYALGGGKEGEGSALGTDLAVYATLHASNEAPRQAASNLADRA